MNSTNKKDVNINIHHITRVEGHGNLVLDIKQGKIEKLELQVVESPRLFEVMFRGRPYHEVFLIASRICGICSIAHSLASIQAIEKAMDIHISEQTRLLRRLMMNAEFIESHILHVYFLAAPDFFNLGSVVPLASSHPDVVKRALRLKKLGNEICIRLIGRKVHSISMAVKTFLKTPTKLELKSLLEYIEGHKEDLIHTLELLKTLRIPEFSRETEYVASSEENDYPLIGGKIGSSKRSGNSLDPKDYKELIKESCIEHSTSKHVLSDSGNPIQVGALARFNLNQDKLHPWAKQVAEELGLKAPSYNTFLITIAQFIETIHVFEDSILTIQKLLDMNLKQEDISVEPQEGRGVGIVEAPRGLLIHDYTINKKGNVVQANCIIPTGMNYANIEADLHHMVPDILEKPKSEIAKTMEMLVRAYDPCISCSVHYLNVEFKE